MKLDKEIRDLLDAIDEVLQTLDQPPLLSNDDFLLDDMSAEFYFKAHFRKEAGIKLTIILSPSEIRLDIDRAVEAFHIDPRRYQHDWTEFKGLMMMIFTSRIKVEYCGANFTKIEFYDSDQRNIDSIKYVQGPYLRINCQTKEYDPIYEYA